MPIKQTGGISPRLRTSIRSSSQSSTPWCLRSASLPWLFRSGPRLRPPALPLNRFANDSRPIRRQDTRRYHFRDFHDSVPRADWVRAGIRFLDGLFGPVTFLCLWAKALGDSSGGFELGSSGVRERNGDQLSRDGSFSVVSVGLISVFSGTGSGLGSAPLRAGTLPGGAGNCGEAACSVVGQAASPILSSGSGC